jgi:uncharacterized protein (DUF58 family)
MIDTPAALRADLVDPATIMALGRLEIVARWVVDGFLQGLHRSPRKGFSVEFAEHRPYQPGDDLRYIDWKVLARADRWLVKQYEEETNLRASIVLDVSKSMDWRGDPSRLTKLNYAEMVVAAVSLLLLKQRDAVGLIRFDSEPRTVIQPRARLQQWMRIIRALSEDGRARATNPTRALLQAAKNIKRPGLVFVLSDLLFEQEEFFNSISALRGAGHDVQVMHILDPAERDLPSVGDAEFVDPESGRGVFSAAADMRVAYRETVMKALDEFRGGCAASGAGYQVVFTDEPFVVPLRLAFAKRQRSP